MVENDKDSSIGQNENETTQDEIESDKSNKKYREGRRTSIKIHRVGSRHSINGI